MAEEPRLTKQERRERDRAKRKQQQAEAERRRRRGKVRTALVSAGIVLAAGAVLYQALAGGPATIDDPITVAAEEAEEAREAAGCELLTERDPLPEPYHVDASSDLDVDAVYSDTRPTHSGPHTSTTHPPVAASDSPISEVSSTHNLEHGAVIVWHDPDTVDDATASEIGDWAELLSENGLTNARAGVAVMSSPYEGEITSGGSIALRAWGTALDCDSWSETVAHAFVLEHFGANGIAPERGAAGEFPHDVLTWADADADAAG